MNKYNYKINGEDSIEIDLLESVFYPTGTTEEIIKSVSRCINNPGKLLDLGCGAGLVGIALSLMGKAKGTLYASDLSEDASNLTKANALKFDIPIISLHGSVFEPWNGEKFDYIVDDISGISEIISDISPWFKNTSCRSGNDGTDLTIEVIDNSSQYLKKNGVLFFPILSLSNSEKIINYAKTKFNNVEMISRKDWRIPDELLEHKDLLFKLRDKGHINFKEKYGWLLFSTEVYSVQNSK
jgi:methylase of polypeptide subunit release factors